MREVIFMATVKLNNENFYRQVMESEIPVLVDFYAGWCSPCRMLAPVLEDISDELSGKVTVGKVDVTEENELAEKFRILNLPTMLVFRKGEITDTLVGAAGKQQIMALFQ